MIVSTESLTLMDHGSPCVTIRPPPPEASALSTATTTSLQPRVTVRILGPEPVRFSTTPTLRLPVAHGPHVSAQRYAAVRERRANLIDIYI